MIFGGEYIVPPNWAPCNISVNFLYNKRKIQENESLGVELCFSPPYMYNSVSDISNVTLDAIVCVYKMFIGMNTISLMVVTLLNNI